MNSQKTLAQDCLDLRAIRLRSSDVKRGDSVHPRNLDSFEGTVFGYNKVRATTVNTGTFSDGTDLWAYTFLYAVGIKVEDEKAENSDDLSGLEIRAEFESEYASKEELPVDEISGFSENNVGYHIWPYWREFVKSTLGRMELPHTLIGIPFCFAAHNAAITADENPVAHEADT